MFYEYLQSRKEFDMYIKKKGIIAINIINKIIKAMIYKIQLILINFKPFKVRGS